MYASTRSIQNMPTHSLLHEQLLNKDYLPRRDYANNIISNVQKLATILGSSEVAVDRRHAPAIYSKFLFTLLDTTKPGSCGANSTNVYRTQAQTWASVHSLDRAPPVGTSFPPYTQAGASGATAGTSFSFTHFAQTVGSLRGPSSTGSSSPEQGPPSPSPTPPQLHWRDEVHR